MKKTTCIQLMVTFLVTTVSCSSFLNEKPNRSLATPNNLNDLQALLDNESILTIDYPESGDIAANYYYISEQDWLSRNIDVRNTYAWSDGAQYYRDWNNSYQKIHYCNVVIDEVDDAELRNMTEADRNEIKGRALFFRAWSYFQLSQVYSPFYQKGVSDSEYGLPLKLQSDINERIVRSSVQETYSQIVDDLTRSASLLPPVSIIATRPSKVAAYAALGKLYLIIGEYEKALSYADQALAIKRTLIDYNTLDSLANLPFEMLNEEVLFHAVASSLSGVHAQSRAFVDTALVAKYAEHDIRKKVFFRQDASGYYRFKGSYTGSANTLLAGIATDELYLTKAECQARLGQDVEALETLNALLLTRWETGTFEPHEDLSGDVLLDLILEERAKELVFRGGIRWSDLRRLNNNPRYAKTLVRKIGDQVYELPPNDLRYTFLIPANVVQMSGIKQNPR